MRTFALLTMPRALVASLAALCLALSPARAQTILLPQNASGWAYLHPVSGGSGSDPGTLDADFDTTWLDQSLGTYMGAATYDGPAFVTGVTAPFSYGGVDGITGGTGLAPVPASGTRGAAYFLKVIDGGVTGYSNLLVTLLADDGAHVSLNGVRIASKNMPAGPAGWATTSTTTGSETDFSSLAMTGNPVLRPGPNLLAVSVHQAATTSSDLGFRMEISATAGVPDIYEQRAINVGETGAEIVWRSVQAGDSTVRYGPVAGSWIGSATIPGSRTLHAVPLAGLQPQVTYYFEVETIGPGFTGVASGSFTTAAPASAIAITRGPYLQCGGADRVTICWRTAQAGDSVVRHGSALGTLDQTVTLAGSRTDHAVTITGLPAGARRYYRVETNGAGGAQALSPLSAAHFFDTSPTPGSTGALRVWVVGDSGTAGASAASVYQGFRTMNGGDHADVWLMLGDNAYNDGTDAEYQAAVFAMYPDTLRNSVLWSTLGNHDAHLEGFVPPQPLPYLDIFHHPTAGEVGGVASGTERYYSFDYANVHFICLDSQTAGNYNDAPGGGGMVDWLAADLAATDKDWVIAYYHHGPYTKGSHDSDVESHHIAIRQYITPLLEQYGVDLVLAGHSHQYERSRLIDGHYGLSATFNASMVKDGGNGSEVGGVNAAGAFQTGAAFASGAYQKPLAVGNAGAVYSIVGASGQVSAWDNGSTALVNPAPHTAHLVNLRLLGSMVLDIEGGRLRARYIDPAGALRDDFTIVKGSTFTITTTDGAFAETGADTSAQFRIARTGAAGLADSVNFTPAGNTTPGADHTAAVSQAFAPEESARHVTLTALADDRAEGAETAALQIAPATRAVQPGAAARRAYFIGAPSLATATLADAPAQAWWFQWFGPATLTPGDWLLDPDGDGLTHRHEYALGGDPLALEAAPLTSISADGGVLELHFTRDHRRTDVTIVPETSLDLGTWTDAGIADVLDGAPNPTGAEPRKATVPMDVGRRFLRLNIIGP